MQYDNTSATIAGKESLAVNKLIKNTYTLLALTLLFSAATATVSMIIRTPSFFYYGSIILSLLLIWFVLPRTDQSAAGVGVVFAITGLMGFSLGPILNAYMGLPRGPEIIATAMGGTGVIFLALSAYALISRKDFSFMGGFLFTGLIVMLIAMIANIFLAIPLMSLTISGVMVLLMSGYILYDTSAMIHGGETNYIHATINLYLNIFNLFIHLLRILGMLGDD
ncbi:membrane protein [Achromatium sp. WMS3]|nr:membrane protein [Achromatium sp. WMS3]